MTKEAAWTLSVSNVQAYSAAVAITDYSRRYGMGFVIGVLVIVALVLAIVYLSDRT